MAPLTADQEAHAHAWAAVFQDSQAVSTVLDDMQQYARQMSEPLERAGATSLILYVLLKRNQLRRYKGKEAKRG